MTASNQRILLICLTSLICLTTSVSAQTEIAADLQASVVFDLDVKKFRESKLVEAYGFDRLTNDFALDETYTGFDPKTVNRIWALGRFPNDVRDMMRMVPGDNLPFQFAWVVEVTEIPAKFKAGAEANCRIVEKDGKEYYCPPDFPDIFLRFEDELAFACTEAYLSLDTDLIMSQGLKAALNRLPDDHMAKVAVDVDLNRGFVDGIYELEANDLRNILPSPEILPLLRPYKNIDQIALSLDLSDSVLARGFAVSNNETDAAKFETDFAQMLRMVRLGGMMLMGQAGIEDPSDKKTFKSVLQQLNASRNGVINEVEIRQPEGFDQLIASMTSLVRIQAEEANKTNRFRQVALSIHNFHDAYRRLPFGDMKNERFNPNLSWRTRVGPFMEVNLNFDNSKAWDADENQGFANQMPEIFGRDQKNTDVVWIESNAETLETISDGCSNTIMLLENPKGTPWTQSKDIRILEAIKLIKGLEDGETLIAVMYDASCHRIDNTLTHNQLKAMLTPGGGETVDVWELLNR